MSLTCVFLVLCQAFGSILTSYMRGGWCAKFESFYCNDTFCQWIQWKTFRENSIFFTVSQTPRLLDWPHQVIYGRTNLEFMKVSRPEPVNSVAFHKRIDDDTLSLVIVCNINDPSNVGSRTGSVSIAKLCTWAITAYVHRHEHFKARWKRI